MTATDTPIAAFIELSKHNQWINWRHATRDGKPTKLPSTPSGRNCDAPDPANHLSVADAVSAFQRNPKKLAGIGFVFTPEDEFIGIDLDDSYDRETGELTDWARPIVEDLNTYAEVSPSGTGVKLWAFGKKPSFPNRKGEESHACRKKQIGSDGTVLGEVEMYDRGRFFTFTGDHLPGTPEAINPAQAAIKRVYFKYLDPARDPEKQKKPTLPPIERRAPTLAELDAASPVKIGESISDEQLIAWIRRTKQASKFADLFDRGDAGAFGNDDSRADSSLAGILAFYTKDERQIERIMDASALGSREKWRDREDYRARTISKALELVTGQATRPTKSDARPASDKTAASPAKPKPLIKPPPGEPFPVDQFPPPVQAFISEAAAAQQVDPSFITAPLLAALGAAIGNSRLILLKSGYVQPPLLWAGIIGDSGFGKSPSLKVALKPIWAYFDALKARFDADLADYAKEQAEYDATPKSKRSADAKPPLKPTLDQNVIQNATCEAIISLLQANERGLFCSVDELAGHFKSFNSYKKSGSDKETWLEMFDAATAKTNRKGNPGAGNGPQMIYVKRAFVGLAGGIQPATLTKFLTDEDVDAGMFARFLFVYPEAQKIRWNENVISKETENAITEIFPGCTHFKWSQASEGASRL